MTQDTGEGAFSVPVSKDPPQGVPILFANLIDSVGGDGYVMLDLSVAYAVVGAPIEGPSVSVTGVDRQRVARVFVPSASFERWLRNLLANNPAYKEMQE